MPKTEEFRHWLKFLWFSEIHHHQVDREAHLFNSETYEPDTDVIENLPSDEIESIVANVTRWRADAEKRYQAFATRFVEGKLSNSLRAALSHEMNLRRGTRRLRSGAKVDNPWNVKNSTYYLAAFQTLRGQCEAASSKSRSVVSNVSW
jgi:hypothetical protein